MREGRASQRSLIHYSRAPTLTKKLRLLGTGRIIRTLLAVQSPEDEAFLLMNAYVLMFWKKKLVKRQKHPYKNYHRLKGGGGAGARLPKYALSCVLLREKI